MLFSSAQMRIFILLPLPIALSALLGACQDSIITDLKNYEQKFISVQKFVNNSSQLKDKQKNTGDPLCSWGKILRNKADIGTIQQGSMEMNRQFRKMCSIFLLNSNPEAPMVEFLAQLNSTDVYEKLIAMVPFFKDPIPLLSTILEALLETPAIQKKPAQIFGDPAFCKLLKAVEGMLIAMCVPVEKTENKSPETPSIDEEKPDEGQIYALQDHLAKQISEFEKCVGLDCILSRKVKLLVKAPDDSYRVTLEEIRHGIEKSKTEEPIINREYRIWKKLNDSWTCVFTQEAHVVRDICPGKKVCIITNSQGGVAYLVISDKVSIYKIQHPRNLAIRARFNSDETLFALFDSGHGITIYESPALSQKPRPKKKIKRSFCKQYCNKEEIVDCQFSPYEKGVLILATVGASIFYWNYLEDMGFSFSAYTGKVLKRCKPCGRMRLLCQHTDGSSLMLTCFNPYVFLAYTALVKNGGKMPIKITDYTESNFSQSSVLFDLKERANATLKNIGFPSIGNTSTDNGEYLLTYPSPTGSSSK
ncbi:MAG: hypothetical protein M1549_01435 [Candidatus Dependentiae bacterium]|nr:hypothetical protein [Candidatus Dependentiae bacterium]